MNKVKSIKSILMMANFANDTGFAWNNIYGLFSSVARSLKQRGVNSYVSFVDLNYPLSTQFSEFEDVFQLVPCSLRYKHLLAVWKVVKEREVDVLYLTDQSHAHVSYLLYRIMGVKKIIVHNRISVPSPDPCQNEIGFRPALKWLWARVPLVNCDEIYAVSGFVKNRLVNKAKVAENRINVILNGIDTDKFKPESFNRKSTSCVFRIFCGGRASTHKGFQYVFEAVSILGKKRSIDNIVVDYAGDGPALEHLKKVVQNHGIESRVNFMGQLPSTESFQRNADVIVVPSVWGDACPSAVIEAMASGKPLVTTLAGGIPELVGDMDNAMLVAHSDAGAIADALEKLMDDESFRETISRNARVRAVTSLDIKRYHQDVIHALTSDMNLIDQ